MPWLVAIKIVEHRDFSRRQSAPWFEFPEQSQDGPTVWTASNRDSLLFTRICVGEARLLMPLCLSAARKASCTLLFDIGSVAFERSIWPRPSAGKISARLRCVAQ